LVVLHVNLVVAVQYKRGDLGGTMKLETCVNSTSQIRGSDLEKSGYESIE